MEPPSDQHPAPAAGEEEAPPPQPQGPDAEGGLPAEEEEGEKGEEEEEQEVVVDGDDTSTLAYAEELIEKGKKLRKAGDNDAAVDCLSRAVEICVSLHGELSPDCVKAYYEYGRALLYKAQDESDPLADIPKDPNIGSSKAAAANMDGQCSSSSAKIETNGAIEAMSCDAGEKDEDSSVPVAAEKHKAHMEVADDGSAKKDVEDGCDKSEDEDVEGEEDGDESDLDLAWKMLDVARAIVEKQPEDTMQKVEILEALGEVSLEREDIETSLSDYLKALNILEHLDQPDSRHIAEINFRVSLVLELSARVDEAVPYCKKAISLCGARLERLKQETKDLGVSTAKAGEASLLDLNQSADDQSQASITSEKLKEIKALSDLLNDLEKKLEDLEQAAQNPKSVVSELMKIMGSKSSAFITQQNLASKETGQIGNGALSSLAASASASASASNGSSGKEATVTDLGVVGRGVKRVNVSSSGAEPALKKPTSE